MNTMYADGAYSLQFKIIRHTLDSGQCLLCSCAATFHLLNKCFIKLLKEESCTGWWIGRAPLFLYELSSFDGQVGDFANYSTMDVRSLTVIERNGAWFTKLGWGHLVLVTGSTQSNGSPTVFYTCASSLWITSTTIIDKSSIERSGRENCLATGLSVLWCLMSDWWPIKHTQSAFSVSQTYWIVHILQSSKPRSWFNNRWWL